MLFKIKQLVTVNQKKKKTQKNVDRTYPKSTTRYMTANDPHRPKTTQVLGYDTAQW